MKVLLFITLILITGCRAELPQEEMSKVPVDAFDVQPLLLGKPVPDVSLTDINDQSFSIAGILSKKPTLIIFYRGGWCPFCSAHLAELVHLVDEISNLGYQILAISPDRPEFLRQSLENQDLNYTLLSDSSMEAARAFGIAYRVDDNTVERLKQNGMDIVERSGEEHRQLPVPAVFITDQSSQILFQYVNPEYRERISSKILMAALRAFQD